MGSATYNSNLKKKKSSGTITIVFELCWRQTCRTSNHICQLTHGPGFSGVNNQTETFKKLISKVSSVIFGPNQAKHDQSRINLYGVSTLSNYYLRTNAIFIVFLPKLSKLFNIAANNPPKAAL